MRLENLAGRLPAWLAMQWREWTARNAIVSDIMKLQSQMESLHKITCIYRFFFVFLLVNLVSRDIEVFF